MSSLSTNSIKTKDEFAAFLDDILADYRDHGATWENADLPRFIEAMQAWLRDCDGFYRNQREDTAAISPWRCIADATAAARIYE